MWRNPLITMIALIATSFCAFAGDPSPASQRQALLVGCTKYPNCKRVKELHGPLNDVPLFSRVLTERFGFEEKNIVRLLGWPDDPAQRPTHQNIVQAFEQLVEKAGPGSQIVILMTGHGTQVPIPDTQLNPLDPKNPEPDGLDEVFLPADVTKWSTNGLGNAIRDDQIGRWLDAMRDKGASVWILFDCCHSGTITRGDEVPRSAAQEDLEIPAEVRTKARPAAVQPGIPQKEIAAIELPLPNGAEGSVTAFYAAQSFEEAPELPRPSGAARVPANYYGLMTYVVSQALLEQPEGRSLTYRDLSQIVLGRYRAERGSRGPTPLFDIRDNRKVLGLTAEQWPRHASLVFEKHDGELRVVGGTLRGLIPGSVLKLFAPGAGGTDTIKPLAFVRVKTASATAAIVEPCEHEGMQAVAVDVLPAIGRCELVSRDLGDMRVRIRIRPSSNKELTTQNAILSDSLEQLPPASKALVTTVEADEEAWTLWLASPSEARDAGISLKQSEVLLIHSDALTVVPPVQGAANPGTRPQHEMLSHPSAQYPVGPARDLAAALDVDIPRIFAWQCLWRLTGQMGGQRAHHSPVSLEVAAVRAEDDPTSGELLRGEALHPGQFLEVRVANPGDEGLWVTVLFLGADHSIEVFASEGVAAGKALSPFRIQINDSSHGNEGLVVLSLPMSEYRQQPDFQFLEQPGLGARHRGGGDQPAAKEPQTLFGKLVQSALRGKQTRGPAPGAPENPDFTCWTWTTLPAPKGNR